jgi:hypothetical protein
MPIRWALADPKIGEREVLEALAEPSDADQSTDPLTQFVARAEEELG